MQRDVQYEDIINIEKPKLVTISPDGKKIAFVIQKANFDKNYDLDTLFLHEKESSITKKLTVLTKIKKIIWEADTCYVLGEENKKYIILSVKDSKISTVILSKIPISAFTVSVDQLYYNKITSASNLVLKKVKEEGYVYRWRKDDLTTITSKKYQHFEYEEIRFINKIPGKNQLLKRFDYHDWFDTQPLINTMALSANGRYLAVDSNRLGKPELGECACLRDIVIIDIKSKKSYKILEGNLTSKISPCWINENELVFQETDYQKNYIFWKWDAQTKKGIKLNVTTNKIVNSLTWHQEKELIITEYDKELHQFSPDAIHATQVDLPAQFFKKTFINSVLSWDLNCQCLATVNEDSKTPPEVIFYDVKEKKIKPMTHLNPDVKNIALGNIEPITIKMSEGIEATGYLLHPIGEIPQKRYPLIIATYGFSGQQFALNAQEWHSTFPAQVFAKEGYFVLLLNHLGVAQNLAGNDKEARDIEGWRVLKCFEQAIFLLEEKGLIDAVKPPNLPHFTTRVILI